MSPEQTAEEVRDTQGSKSSREEDQGRDEENSPF